MKWSSEKFQNQLSRMGVSYEDLADRLTLLGWLSLREFVVLQLRGFAHGIAPARYRDCSDIAKALGIHVNLLLEEENLPSYSSGTATRLNCSAERHRLSA